MPELVRLIRQDRYISRSLLVSRELPVVYPPVSDIFPERLNRRERGGPRDTS